MDKNNVILNGIRSRFFLVLDELKKLGIIGGLKGFSDRCGVDRSNIARRKNSDYGNIPTEWLVLLAKNYSVSTDYLLLGEGSMFIRGFDAEIQKKLQEECMAKQYLSQQSDFQPN